MTDLSASQLHALVSPLWERWAETRPTRPEFNKPPVPLTYRDFSLDGQWGWNMSWDRELVDIPTATALCVARMVEVLRKWNTQSLEWAIGVDGPLLQNLVAECHRHLDSAGPQEPSDAP